MRCRSKLLWASGAVICLATSGCGVKGATASFGSLKTPVLLGPRDRIGGGSTLLKTSKLSEFEAEAVKDFRQHSDANYNYVTEEATRDGAIEDLARETTKEDPNIDIRLTDVMPAAYVVLAGTRSKQYVSIEGDVVRVTGGQK
jgi:hypothetical protein